MALDVTIKEKEKGAFLAIPDGEINTETYKVFESKVMPVITAGIKALVIDLQGVTYISSMGLGVLFRAKHAVNGFGGSMIIINPRSSIKDVFETVKFIPDKIFTSLKAADEYFDQFLDDIQKGKIKPGSGE